MKKMLLIAAAAAAGIVSAQGQEAMTVPGFGSNWSLGIDGGVTTPLSSHHSFFGDMRGAFGLHLQKQISPVFGLGIEGMAGINTSSWRPAPFRSKTMIDNSYVGVYGAVNLMNLFGGYLCAPRPFEIELVGGAGWGHEYMKADHDQNYFATKAGFNFNYNATSNLTLSLKPYVAWNMSGTRYEPLGVEQSTAAYSRKGATFNLMASVTYNFGPGFDCVDTRNQAEIDALNARINDLRGQIEACAAAGGAADAQAAALAAELQACQNRKPQVIKEVTNNLESVRYIFYKIGSAVITPDQQPNVEMVAEYLNNHPNSKVIIKGYASSDGNLDFNLKLAAKRAESVKEALIKRYKISSARIQAEGCGIGEMFSEQSWNRVSICTLEE